MAPFPGYEWFSCQIWNVSRTHRAYQRAAYLLLVGNTEQWRQPTWHRWWLPQTISPVTGCSLRSSALQELQKNNMINFYAEMSSLSWYSIYQHLHTLHQYTIDIWSWQSRIISHAVHSSLRALHHHNLIQVVLIHMHQYLIHLHSMYESNPDRTCSMAEIWCHNVSALSLTSCSRPMSWSAWGVSHMSHTCLTHVGQNKSKSV